MTQLCPYCARPLDEVGVVDGVFRSHHDGRSVPSACEGSGTRVALLEDDRLFGEGRVMRLVKVELRLHHDKGHATVGTVSTSVAMAVKLILGAEGAPASAIRRVRVWKV